MTVECTAVVEHLKYPLNITNLPILSLNQSFSLQKPGWANVHPALPVPSYTPAINLK